MTCCWGHPVDSTPQHKKRLLQDLGTLCCCQDSIMAHTRGKSSQSASTLKYIKFLQWCSYSISLTTRSIVICVAVCNRKSKLHHMLLISLTVIVYHLWMISPKGNPLPTLCNTHFFQGCLEFISLPVYILNFLQPTHRSLHMGPN